LDGKPKLTVSTLGKRKSRTRKKSQQLRDQLKKLKMLEAERGIFRVGLEGLEAQDETV
jgi:5'-3' exonuclease